MNAEKGVQQYYGSIKQPSEKELGPRNRCWALMGLGVGLVQAGSKAEPVRPISIYSLYWFFSTHSYKHFSLFT